MVVRKRFVLEQVTLTSSGDSDFVGVVTAKGFEVGTAATISNNGNATLAGIVTAVIL